MSLLYDSSDGGRPESCNSPASAARRSDSEADCQSVSAKSEDPPSYHEFKEKLQSGLNFLFRRNKTEKKANVPAALVKVRLNKKPDCEFASLLFIQDLSETSIKDQINVSYASLSSSTASLASLGANSRPQTARPPRRISSAIWALEFSLDGNYLAAAGQEGSVWVWEVADAMTPLCEPTLASSILYGEREPKAFAVFKEPPAACFQGHTSDVLDLSWSPSNFLASCSSDKTARIWHLSRKECLAIFEHPDYVTSIQFHPMDDRYFLSGSLDGRLRVWSVPEKSCVACRIIPDSLLTAVCFAAGGKIAVAGTLTGKCFFFETEGLKYNTQLQIKDSSSAKMKKITGIRSIPSPLAHGDEKILVSSNDSRVRIYHLRDKSIASQFKGLENNFSQLRASITEDGLYIVCGSENRKILIWNNPLDDEQSIAANAYATRDTAEDSSSVVDLPDTDSMQSETRSLDTTKSAWPRFHFNNPLKSKKIKESLTAAFRRNRSLRYEFFQAHMSRVSATIFAPNSVRTRMRRILDANEFLVSLKENKPMSAAQDAIIVSSDVDGHIKVFMNCRNIPGISLDDSSETNLPDTLATLNAEPEDAYSARPARRSNSTSAP